MLRTNGSRWSRTTICCLSCVAGRCCGSPTWPLSLLLGGVWWSSWNGGWASNRWQWNESDWNWQSCKTGHFPKGDFADPPQWPGWPHYRHWKRALARWNTNTDVPMWRRAEKVLRQFTWEFQTHFDHLSEEQLSGSGYLEHITAILDILEGERSSAEKRRTIRAALYEGSRRSDEGLAQYCASSRGPVCQCRPVHDSWWAEGIPPRRAGQPEQAESSKSKDHHRWFSRLLQR